MKITNHEAISSGCQLWRVSGATVTFTDRLDLHALGPSVLACGPPVHGRERSTKIGRPDGGKIIGTG